MSRSLWLKAGSGFRLRAARTICGEIAGGDRWQISAGGGTRPLWARNGQELFYITSAVALIAVRVERGPTFTAGTLTSLVVVRNWFEELKRLVPLNQ